MAITYSNLETRISEELRLLGAFKSSVVTNLLKDALTDFCRQADPVISATFAVVDDTQYYAYPVTIKKISALLDDSEPPVEIPYDDYPYKRYVYLQDDPGESANWTMYGTPYNVRTNYQTIIAALQEEWADCLWQYCRAHCHKQAKAADWVQELQEAKRMTREERRSRNRNDDIISQVMQQRDVRGYVTDDTSNAEGRSVDNDDFLEVDVGG